MHSLGTEEVNDTSSARADQSSEARRHDGPVAARVETSRLARSAGPLVISAPVIVTIEVSTATGDARDVTAALPAAEDPGAAAR